MNTIVKVCELFGKIPQTDRPSELQCFLDMHKMDIFNIVGWLLEIASLFIFYKALSFSLKVSAALN